MTAGEMRGLARTASPRAPRRPRRRVPCRSLAPVPCALFSWDIWPFEAPGRRSCGARVHASGRLAMRAHRNRDFDCSRAARCGPNPYLALNTPQTLARDVSLPAFSTRAAARAYSGVNVGQRGVHQGLCAAGTVSRWVCHGNQALMDGAQHVSVCDAAG